VTDVLSRRRLNRATLARQWLLERAPAGAVDAIEHLGGMQSQAPLAPYVGLWSRLRDFRPEELSTLTERREVVRLHLMRHTVHLVSARDALDWLRLFKTGEVPAALAGGEPTGRAALVRLVGERGLPQLPVCQVPPRGLWRRNGPVAWVPVETWLGSPLRVTPVDDLVLRCLGAFGPAGVADVQQWSGLTRLREVVERLPLRTFHDEAGRILYDLPDAPRPDEDVAAPPRFLPEYDNLLLSHRDRTRVIRAGRVVPLPPGNGATTGTFLVDGFWAGVWRFRDRQVTVEAFDELPAAEHDALRAEADRLAAFLTRSAAERRTPPRGAGRSAAG
jgi:winged helix DNA-binding protein